MLATRYRRLVRASAIYDLLATAAFATPWTFAIVTGQLGKLTPLPPFEPLHVLFANLMGSLVVVWAVLRIREPRPIFGLFDAFGRGLFFTWQMHYLLVMNGSPILWLFAIPELALGLLQGYGYWILHKVRTASPTRCRVVRHFALAGA
jgi:hypothetical protein